MWAATTASQSSRPIPFLESAAEAPLSTAVSCAAGPVTTPGRWYADSMTPYLIAFAISATLTCGLLWAVGRWTGLALPVPDIVLLALLCSGLALLPRVGWVLGMLIMCLVLLRTTEAGVWPETVLMVAGSGIIWVIAYTAVIAPTF